MKRTLRYLALALLAPGIFVLAVCVRSYYVPYCHIFGAPPPPTTHHGVTQKTLMMIPTAPMTKEINIYDGNLLVTEIAIMPEGYFFVRNDLSVPLFSLGIVLMLPFLLPLLWQLAIRLTKQPNPSLCPACGYDLRATPDRCPECGKVVEKAI